MSPSDTTPPLSISAASSVPSSPMSDRFPPSPSIGGTQQVDFQGEGSDAESTHKSFAVDFPRSDSPYSQPYAPGSLPGRGDNSPRSIRSLSSASSQAPRTPSSHASHSSAHSLSDSTHTSERASRGHLPYPPRIGPTPLELRYFARTTGPSAHLGMTIENVEQVMLFSTYMLLLLILKYKGKNLLQGALTKLPQDILQKAYEAKRADRDSIVHQVAQTAAAIESLERHRVFLAAVKQHQEVELTAAESVLGIVKGMLSPRSLVDVEDDRGYYRAVFADELIGLTVAETQLQQIGGVAWSDRNLSSSCARA
ncbi:hypothetical protein JVU11DRAFT_937 [Chiua virens]|nr:hypothetical protein JVU11DRAFT_937 [Chiua virens]